MQETSSTSFGEGEEILERGEAPLLPTLPLPLIREGGQGDRLLNNLQFVVIIPAMIN